jgi:hypothetical protein
MPHEWYFSDELERPVWIDEADRYFTQYFESSHAEFLQAAGARIVPLDY